MDDAVLRDLPEPVQRALAEAVRAARQALGESLRAIVLFGSAAEGRLRATSDVNVVIVSTAFERPAVDGLRETLRLAEAAVRLRPMFLLADEVGPASAAFAAKFADVLRRRRVLWGEDPFAALEIPRAAQVARLRQVLLDLGLRLRAAYALRSQREEQLALVLAEAAGPLRASGQSARPAASSDREAPSEALLAAVYSDVEARERFLRAAPAIDRAGLELAVESLARKRAHVAAHARGGRGLLARLRRWWAPVGPGKSARRAGGARR